MEKAIMEIEFDYAPENNGRDILVNIKNFGEGVIYTKRFDDMTEILGNFNDICEKYDITNIYVDKAGMGAGIFNVLANFVIVNKMENIILTGMRTKALKIEQNNTQNSELRKITEPVVNYLKKYGNPHQTVMITDTGVKIVSDDVFIPVK